MKHKSSNGAQEQRSRTKEHRGEAKLTLFCKRVGSFFVKLQLKEALKKPLRGNIAQSPNKKLKPKPN